MEEKDKIELFKKYAGIKNAIKDLEDQKEVLQDALLKEVLVAKDKKVELPFGKFSVTTRKAYKYSEAVENKKEELDLLKIEEQENGLATATESHSLVYKENVI
jgi:hypothetical protein